MATDVCGHLIELISGQRLDAYLKEHVLQPLGMSDTSFVIADDQTKRFAANYQRQRDDRLMCVPWRRRCPRGRSPHPGGRLDAVLRNARQRTRALHHRGCPSRGLGGIL